MPLFHRPRRGHGGGIISMGGRVREPLWGKGYVMKWLAAGEVAAQCGGVARISSLELQHAALLADLPQAMQEHYWQNHARATSASDAQVGQLGLTHGVDQSQVLLLPLVRPGRLLAAGADRWQFPALILDETEFRERCATSMYYCATGAYVPAHTEVHPKTALMCMTSRYSCLSFALWCGWRRCAASTASTAPPQQPPQQQGRSSLGTALGGQMLAPPVASPRGPIASPDLRHMYQLALAAIATQGQAAPAQGTELGAAPAPGFTLRKRTTPAGLGDPRDLVRQPPSANSGCKVRNRGCSGHLSQPHLPTAFVPHFRSDPTASADAHARVEQPKRRGRSQR
ncbi:hypothetical protein HaLaN_20853 [Haematococcus lacustris]|uniref:Uncharacterized protein n=1 Tax=Haematococcus lacustris TaxID=44745 RepID=A0A6A0A219_HAELA|nr:hypothetical protein HaLaN_20853 [Haematococcus lacustris]